MIFTFLGQIESMELKISDAYESGGDSVYVEITHEDSTCETGKISSFYRDNVLLWTKTPTENTLDV